MAGDWIKFEHATLRKPEVAMLCNLLNINRHYCIGMLCEFWMWWDNNASDELVVRMLSGKRPENVRPMTAKSLDDIMEIDGFSAAMTLVGWLEIDEDAGTVRLPNAGEHNGKTAKNRALDNKRKAASRETGQNPDTNRTREEKRRVTTERESITAPTDEHRIIAAKLRLDCEVEWLKYRDQQANAPRKHSDLQAGFRNWLRRAKEFQPQPRPGPAKQEARARVADDIWKGIDDGRSNERVIDGQVERVA
jgi:hypothetical protein